MAKRRVAKMKRRIPKRKRTARYLALVRRKRRFTSVAGSSSNNVDDVVQDQPHRSHDHPYATRSKTLRTAQSSMNMTKNDRAKLERRRSESSIEFLGTYQKIPQLIVLQESSEGRCVEFVEKPEILMRLKTEKIHSIESMSQEQMDCHSSED